MIGAIVGDIVGSRFEFRNRKSKNFTFLKGAKESRHPCRFTDDTVMTLAIAAALMDWKTGGDDLGAIAVPRTSSTSRARDPFRRCWRRSLSRIPSKTRSVMQSPSAVTRILSAQSAALLQALTMASLPTSAHRRRVS